MYMCYLGWLFCINLYLCSAQSVFLCLSLPLLVSLLHGVQREQVSWPLSSIDYWRIWAWCVAAHGQVPSQLQDSRISFSRPTTLLQRDRGMAFSCWLNVKGISEWSDCVLWTTTLTGGKNFREHPPLHLEALVRGCRLPIRGTSFPTRKWTWGGLCWVF